MLNKFEKYWVVWCPEGGAPTVKHPDHDSACHEAARLALKNPGRRFEVLERVSSVVSTTVQWEGELPLPF